MCFNMLQGTIGPGEDNLDSAIETGPFRVDLLILGGDFPRLGWFTRGYDMDDFYTFLSDYLVEARSI